jgi:hypothetical protein
MSAPATASSGALTGVRPPTSASGLTAAPAAPALPAPITFTAPLAERVWAIDFDLGAYRPSQLLELSRALFQHAACLESEPDTPEEARYRVDEESITHFLRQVQSHHHPENTYHGWTHGVHVCYNSLRLLLPVLDRFTHLERFTLLLSAVCHDMQHCGQSNGWCTESEYWCNEDHAAKKYTRNLLERNSVERTIELLTGQSVSVPFGSSPASTSHTDGAGDSHSAASSPSHAPSHPSLPTPSASSASAGASRHFLQEWGFSPSLQEAFIASLSEYILNTDIADKERHRRVTGELTQLVSKQPAATNGTSAANATSSSSDSSSHSFTFSSPSHRLTLTRVLLLCADIGCVSELFPNTLAWADRLYEESVLGQSFVAEQVIQAELPSPLARKAALELRHENVKSRYRYEAEDSSTASHSHLVYSSAEPSFEEDCPTIHGPLIPCSALSAYYSNQHDFFSKYAIPLYAPVERSGLLSNVCERFFPQLMRNLRYIEVTEAVKPQNGKLQIHTHAQVASSAASSSSSSSSDLHSTLQQLSSEFAQIAAFHSSLNAQQSGLHLTEVKSLVFEWKPAAGGDEEAERSGLQPHCDHANEEGVRCLSHA